MEDIRKLAEKSPDMRNVWVESVMSPRSIIESPFSRLKLKDKPIQVDDPVSEDDVSKLLNRISEMFSDLDVTKLQKAHTKKSVSYNKWKEEYCKERKYTFQIRRCNNKKCCLPSSLPLKWLPDPVLADDRDPFKKYIEVTILISHFSEFRANSFDIFINTLYMFYIKGQRYRNNRKRLPIASSGTEKEEKCPRETGFCESDI